MPMMSRLLGLAILAGCAAGRGAAPAPDAAAAADSAVPYEDVCDRRVAVTVHVDNQSSFDVEISFGGYTAARAAPGFARTTYTVARSYLTSTIRLRIARGGVATEGPAVIPAEYVVCNDATLIIGSRPSTSFFYGDLVLPPTRDRPREPPDSAPRLPVPPGDAGSRMRYLPDAVR